MGHTALRFPDGLAGKRAVLAFLSDVATAAALQDPAVRGSAAYALRSCSPAPHSPTARAACLLSFVQGTVLYVPDPVAAELVQAPGRTLTLGIGDCDDMVALLLALLRSVGIRCRPTAQGSAGSFPHVAVQVRLGGRWIWADPTLPGARLGTAAPLPQALHGPEG